MSTRYGDQEEGRGRYGGRDSAERSDNSGTAEQGADIARTASRGTAGPGTDSPNLGSARSDYGQLAYGGRLDEKGVESESSYRGRRQSFFGRLGSGRSDRSTESKGRGTGLMLLGGVGIGSALIYFLAPRQRRSRRMLRQGTLTMKICSDVMTRDPACCLPGDTVDRAAQLMRSEDVGPVPVISDHQTKRLVGIVTDRDLALKVVAEARDARNTRVEDVMTRGVVACRAEDAVQEALDAMAEHQVRRIPVVDADHRIVGIIAQADIATRMEEPEKTAEVVEDISVSRAAGM